MSHSTRSKRDQIHCLCCWFFLSKNSFNFAKWKLFHIFLKHQNCLDDCNRSSSINNGVRNRYRLEGSTGAKAKARTKSPNFLGVVVQESSCEETYNTFKDKCYFKKIYFENLIDTRIVVRGNKILMLRLRYDFYL
jgi:hypothetical protein